MILLHNTQIVMDLCIRHLSLKNFLEFFLQWQWHVQVVFLHSSVEVVWGERTIVRVEIAYFIIEIGDIMYELNF